MWEMESGEIAGGGLAGQPVSYSAYQSVRLSAIQIVRGQILNEIG